MPHIVQTETWALLRQHQGSTPIWVEGHLMLVKNTPAPFKSLGIMSQVDLADINLENIRSKGTRLSLSHIQLDPNDKKEDFAFTESQIEQLNLQPVKSLIPRETIHIDLTKDEDTLLEEMKKNWRYNCKYSKKKGVEVEFRQDAEAVEEFINIYFDTVEAKGFLGRKPDYFRQVWKYLHKDKKAIIALGKHEGKVIVGRMLFLHEGMIYTAYTGTTRDREMTKLKAAYGVVWEIMRWGKENGYQTLNMWGINTKAAETDPEYGYTQFKLGFGGIIVEHAPAYDMVIDPIAYNAFKVANQLRLAIARLKATLPF